MGLTLRAGVRHNPPQRQPVARKAQRNLHPRARVISTRIAGLPISLACLVAPVIAAEGPPRGDARLSWEDLPALPDVVGLGGPFVGVSGETLVVAGGANFPSAPPWEDGAKMWHDRVWTLEVGASAWEGGFTLDRPLAYGGSVTCQEGLLIIGGADGDSVLNEVSLLESHGGRIQSRRLPPLPAPSAYLAAGRAGRIVYVAAGHSGLDPTSALRAFWKLDLSRPPEEMAWVELEPWPGPPRAKAVGVVQSAGVSEPSFYLFSGESATRGADGATRLEYLTDAYRFDPPTASWTRLSELPFPVAAAAAWPAGQSHVLVFSGSSGEHVGEPLEEQPEFPRRILAYHTITDTWVEAGEMPQGVVTTTAVGWADTIVIPSGEVRPGVRTPRVQRVRVDKPSARFGSVNTAVLAVYLVFLVGVGVWFSRREKTTRDYFVAGQRIPWWAAGISIYATQLSAITFISTPAVSYATNWRIAPAWLMILVMAPIVVAFYLPFFRRLEVTTAYEYLERRFSIAVRLFGSGSFIAYQLARMAVVVFLPALTLSAITGLDIYVCILLMGGLSTLYTVLGGMEAVVWTDVAQAIVLFGGMAFGLVSVVVDAGGVGEVYRIASSGHKLDCLDWNWDVTALTTWTVVIGALALQFGPYTTDQAVIQRYLTTRDEPAAARGIWLNGLVSVPFGLLFLALGTCFYVFFRSRPELLSVGMQNDEVFPLFVARQLPPGISGLVIAGAFAASMSSLDSGMHSVATAITTDFYGRFRAGASDRRNFILARIVTVVVGLLGTGIACALAAYDIRSLFFFFQKVLGLVGSGLAGVFILGIFTRRSHAAGVLTGAIVSAFVVAYLTWFTPVSFYLYGFAGITTCVLVGFVASLILPHGPRELAGLTLATLSRRDVSATDTAPGGREGSGA